MTKKPKENNDQRLKRIKEAVAAYKGDQLDFLPMNGGKFTLPEDIVFLLDEIERLDLENHALLDEVDGRWR